MTHFVCETCGTQFAASDAPPARCPICEDERQYVGWSGQRWTSLEALRGSHRVALREEEPGLTGVGMEPSFAIGQRALLVEAPGGNVMWDCIPLVDDAGVEAVRALGGAAVIAISHPHYYSGMVEWSRALGGAPVYLHAADRAWVMRPDPAVVLWEGETLQLGPGLTLVRCGGHFEGGTALHWAAGAGGQGALLAGDIINVVSDRRWVSFMRSFPNLIPLDGRAVRGIVRAVAPFEFARVYSAWYGRVVAEDGRAAVLRSAERYLRAIGDPGAVGSEGASTSAGA